MKYLIPFIVLTAAAVVQASDVSQDAHGSGEIPFKQILYQSINVIIIVAGLIYFLKDSVRKFFKDKKANYISAAEKAESARKIAEQELLQIQSRLLKLENSADESISRARAEAADMKQQLTADSKALSKKIREEAEQAAQFEIEKAQHQIREVLIKESIAAAKAQFSSQVSNEDQLRLQSDFVSHLQAVQK